MSKYGCSPPGCFRKKGPPALFDVIVWSVAALFLGRLLLVILFD